MVVVLLPILLLELSCKARVQSKADLVKYINDPANGLQKTEEAGGAVVRLTYQPWQLIAAHQFEGVADSSPEREQRIVDLQRKHYFLLSFAKDDKELLRQLPFDRYSEMVQVLSFRMADYVSMMPDEGDAIEPDDCLFQQTYGMSNANTLLLIFDKEKVGKADQLTIRLKEAGLNIGNLNFVVETKDIEQLSSVDYQKLL
jgi:hypothetical protein